MNRNKCKVTLRIVTELADSFSEIMAVYHAIWVVRILFCRPFLALLFFGNYRKLVSVTRYH